MDNSGSDLDDRGLNGYIALTSFIHSDWPVVYGPGYLPQKRRCTLQTRRHHSNQALPLLLVSRWPNRLPAAKTCWTRMSAPSVFFFSGNPNLNLQTCYEKSNQSCQIVCFFNLTSVALPVEFSRYCIFMGDYCIKSTQTRIEG